MIKNVYTATGVCGKLIGATAIMPEHRRETAKDVADWVGAGFEITRVTAEDARQADWCKNGGKCKDCKESEHAN